MTHPHVIRTATRREIPALARIWHAGWHEAHADHVPASLTALRTIRDFERRLAGFGDDLRVAGKPGTPLGFCALKGAALDQLYVDRSARGSGLAVALISDAEARLALRGVALAELDCTPGNDRAARFYRRQGWQEAGLITCQLDTSRGPYPLRVRRFTKRVAP